MGQQWRRMRSMRGRAHLNGKAQAGGQNNRKGNPALEDEIDDLTPRKILASFKSQPRILKLVWDAQPVSTVMLGVLNILQGFIPAATAFVAAALVNAVLSAIHAGGKDGTTTVVVWLVVAQFAIQAISSLLQTLANIFQQLLQEKLSYTVQLQVMEKANSLDLAFFEDAKFYDQLQQAQREAASRPVGMISNTFGFGRTLVTLLSMLAVLVHLSWWIALLALIAPIPSFIASVRYGWRGYQMMRRQSPLRRRDGLLQHPTDDRYLQQGDQALHARRLFHQALPRALDELLQAGA